MENLFLSVLFFILRIILSYLDKNSMDRGCLTFEPGFEQGSEPGFQLGFELQCFERDMSHNQVSLFGLKILYKSQVMWSNA